MTLGTAGAVFSGATDGPGVDQPRLQLAVTDARELRCTRGVSDWEIQAKILARQLGDNAINAANLGVAFVRSPGATTEVAPVHIVQRDGFASGVTSDAETVAFEPVVRTSLPCGTDSARLIARAQVAGETLDATDEFLSGGVAMSASIMFGVVVVGALGLLVMAARR